MADNKGILLATQERSIAQWLDGKFVFKNKLLEAVDGPVFKTIVTIVDDYGIEKLEVNYKEKADELADYLLAEDWENAAIVIFELVALIVKEHASKKE